MSAVDATKGVFVASENDISRVSPSDQTLSALSGSFAITAVMAGAAKLMTLRAITPVEKVAEPDPV